ncbi:MAG: DMT family transporter [Gammaproteobacteria bacterium]|nr:DMT family transporter [Gammaproteobacteria bacterium]
MTNPVHGKSVLLGCAAMLGSTILFSLMHVCVRYLSAELHPFEIAFFRNFLALIFFLPLMLKNGAELLITNNLRWHLLRAGLNVFAMLMFFYALSITQLATVQALSFTAPLFATVMAVLFLGEKVRLRRWMAIIIGFTGVLIILRPGIQPIELGALLVLGSASIWALTMIVIKHLSNTDSPLTITAYVTIFLSILSLIPAIFFWKWPQGLQWGWLLFAAGTGTLGQLLLAKAFAYAETSIVLPFDFAKIIWSASLGYLLFGEYVSVYTFIGATIIFSGACYVAVRERQLEKSAQS